MLPELLHQLWELVKSAYHVERQVLFARRKTGDEPVAFPAGFIYIVMVSKADHARAPHLRLGSGCLFHHSQDLITIGALSFIRYSLEKLIHTCPGRYGFHFSHEISFR